MASVAPAQDARAGRLHAAVQHEHPARMRGNGPWPRSRRRRRHFSPEAGRKERSRHAPQREQRLEQRAPRNDGHQGSPPRRRGRAPGNAPLHQLAADVHQPAVLDAGGAGGFAGTAGQAAVQMQLRARRGRGTFEHLLDEIDPASRSVELITEELVGRAGGVAEPAVDAFPQNGIRLLPFVRVADEIGEVGLHANAVSRES